MDAEHKAQKVREAEQAPRLDLAQHQLADGNSLFSRKQYSDAEENFSQALRHLKGEIRCSIWHEPLVQAACDIHVPGGPLDS